MGYGYLQCPDEGVSSVTATPSTNLGERRQDGLNEYVYVYNKGNTQISKGIGVQMSASSQGSITITSVTGDICAGVVKNATLTTGTYGWLCVKGPCSVEIGDDVVGSRTAATGALLGMMTNGEFYPMVSGSAGTGTTWSAFGYVGVALETINTTASGQAWINTLMA